MMSSEGVETGMVFGNEFYDKAKQYWSNIQPTVDGVLGGFGYISQSDIHGSEKFLSDLFKTDSAPGRGRALDCGAGIGRVTKHLLANFFAKVDLVDQNKDFVNKVTEYVGEIPQVGNLYVAGLQEFEPTEKYDVIWCQWVLGHLTDDHLIQFLKKCQNALAERGVIVIKENHTSSGEVDVDEVDSSLTRPLDLIKKIVADAGLEPIISKHQKDFPKGLYPVVMMALKPKPPPSEPLESSRS
uniref:Alpha N-terminal protein methyltransferase 1 n=1 Tax=Lygus hesperus TaxID=30085 RepID=A0A0A9Z911_LYGHE